MAGRKGVRFDETPPGNSKRWRTRAGRPMPSPYPFPHTDPWLTMSVLSIDGGGSRGYSSLVIMQTLMEKVGEIERVLDPGATSSIHSSAFGPLDWEIRAAPTSGAMPISGYWPCHYFDYIAGLGTGGIIAMLLGRYRMNVNEAMEKYREICAMIVERRLIPPQKRQEPVLSTNHNTSRRPKARTVNLVTAWPSPNEYEENLKSDDKRCRTIICGCDSQLQPFRSYPNSAKPRHDINDVILRCVPRDIPPEMYPDATHYYNNPSRTVLAEVFSLYDHKASTDNRIDLLSIGAGITEPVSARANELQYQMSKQTQRVHEEMMQARPFGLDDYCRLDPLDHDLHDDIGVNEFSSNRSTFHRIDKATTHYLREESTAKELHDFAVALVEKRRLRAQTVQWERWALGISYRCPMFKCGGGGNIERFEDRVGFWKHMCEAHGILRADYDGTQSRGREYDVYEAMGRTREGGFR